MNTFTPSFTNLPASGGMGDWSVCALNCLKRSLMKRRDEGYRHSSEPSQENQILIIEIPDTNDGITHNQKGGSRSA